MVLTIILALILLAIAYGYYTLVYRPKKIYNQYLAILTKLGYRVKAYPYMFLKSSVHQKYKQDQLKYGDRMYSIKHQDTEYDLGLFTALDKVIIEIYNPDLIQEFMGPQSPSLYYKMNFLTANIRRVFGDGLVFSEGPQWKHKRKIMNSVFNYDFIKANIPNIIRICNQNFERTQKEYRANNPDEQKNIVKMDILTLFSCLFSNVILQCFFGIPSTYEEVEGEPISTFLSKLNGDVNIQSYKPLSLLLGEKYLSLGLTAADRDINRRIKILRAIAHEKLQKRLSEIQKEGSKEKYCDIIEALAFTNQMALNSEKKSESNYDFEDIINEFCTFYSAGNDTSSHFIQMMIYYLIQNPSCLEKVRQEIDKVIQTDEDITSDNLKKLTYIDWIQNQTTRMYGPGSGIMIRYATKDHFLKDIPVKKNLGFTVLTIMNHYSKRYYEDPLVFKPERWEHCQKDNHPFALTGFGGGPRTCIGKHLAMVETKICLVKFLKRYKQISLPKSDWKMIRKLIPAPEPMDLTAIIAD